MTTTKISKTVITALLSFPIAFLIYFLIYVVRFYHENGGGLLYYHGPEGPHEVSQPQIVFWIIFVVVFVILLFVNNFNSKSNKPEKNETIPVSKNYELTSAEKDFVDYFILYAKDHKIKKSDLENFFYSNFRRLTLEFTTKYTKNIFRIDNVGEVIESAKNRYHNH